MKIIIISKFLHIVFLYWLTAAITKLAELKHVHVPLLNR
jgi:hypothetical protein